jgi:GTP-binding protein
VERTRLLVHVLDIAPELTAGEDALANHTTIEHELAAHDARLAELPRVLALSKCDLVGEPRVQEALAQWRERLGEDVPVLATSSATGAGLRELANELLRRVPALEAAASSVLTDGAEAIAGSGEPAGELAEHMVFRPAGDSGFTVERIGPRSFAVRGRGIERLLARYDVGNDDAMAYFEDRLRRIGVLKALQAQGFAPGDEIEIAGETFELDPAAPA